MPPNGYQSPVSTAAFRAAPGRNFGALEAGIAISAPVRGFRPTRAACSTTSQQPKPVKRMSSPLARCHPFRSRHGFSAFPAAVSSGSGATTSRGVPVTWAYRITSLINSASLSAASELRRKATMRSTALTLKPSFLISPRKSLIESLADRHRPDLPPGLDVPAWLGRIGGMVGGAGSRAGLAADMGAKVKRLSSGGGKTGVSRIGPKRLGAIGFEQPVLGGTGRGGKGKRCRQGGEDETSKHDGHLFSRPRSQSADTNRMWARARFMAISPNPP